MENLNQKVILFSISIPEVIFYLENSPQYFKPTPWSGLCLWLFFSLSEGRKTKCTTRGKLMDRSCIIIYFSPLWEQSCRLTRPIRSTKVSQRASLYSLVQRVMRELTCKTYDYPVNSNLTTTTTTTPNLLFSNTMVTRFP